MTKMDKINFAQRQTYLKYLKVGSWFLFLCAWASYFKAVPPFYGTPRYHCAKKAVRTNVAQHSRKKGCRQLVSHDWEGLPNQGFVQVVAKETKAFSSAFEQVKVGGEVWDNPTAMLV